MNGPLRLSSWMVAGFLSLIVTGLYLVQVVSHVNSTARSIGIVVEETEQGLVLAEITNGGPAARAGLKSGDILLKMDDRPVRNLENYDRIAASFERGRPIPYHVFRDDRLHVVDVTPGLPIDWFLLLTNGFILACYLSLAWLCHRKRNITARLLFWFSFLVALEMAEPLDIVGNLFLYDFTLCLHFLLSGAQMGVELHLASVIPKPRPWLVRRPWIVPIYYATGLGVALLAVMTYLVEEVAAKDWFPWTSDLSFMLQTDILLPVWAALVLVLLALPAFRYPQPEGRYQALLVFLGVLPWTLYVFWVTVFDVGDNNRNLDLIVAFVLLLYLLAVFIAIFRYRLFDIELVVRRSVLYTGMTFIFLLVFYGSMAVSGVLFSAWEQAQAGTIILVSGASLILGLFFAPFRKAFGKFIDRHLFPERGEAHDQLVTLAGELPSLGKLPKMGDHFVRGVCDIFGLRSACLFLADPQSGALSLLAQTGSETGPRAYLIPPDDPGITRLKRAKRTRPAEEILGISPALDKKLKSLAPDRLTPLLSHDRMVGLLGLGSKRDGRFFPAEEMELFNILAHLAGNVFENVRLFQSATYDGLTGLLRREAVLEMLEHEIQRALRHQGDLTIGLADIDRFKRVNDRHGHLAGDLLLKGVAETLAANLRKTDHIGRYGGEEFLLIFPETDLEGAVIVAEKVRVRIEALSMETDEGAQLKPRISLGLACLEALDDQGESDLPRALIAAADQALYRAKTLGRNRVEPRLVNGRIRASG